MSEKKREIVKWSVEDTEKLIQTYQSYQNLWNVDHPEFYNRSKRKTTFVEIASIFQIPPLEVERKLKNMRSQYLRERRQAEMMSKNGLNYKPKWFGYMSMSFLDNKIRPKFRRNSSVIIFIFIKDSLFIHFISFN